MAVTHLDEMRGLRDRPWSSHAVHWTKLISQTMYSTAVGTENSLYTAQ